MLALGSVRCRCGQGLYRPWEWIRSTFSANKCIASHNTLDFLIRLSLFAMEILISCAFDLRISKTSVHVPPAHAGALKYLDISREETGTRASISIAPRFL